MLRGVKDLNSYEQGSNSANGADVFASPDVSIVLNVTL